MLLIPASIRAKASFALSPLHLKLPSQNINTMGGNNSNVDGVGDLNYQRALDIARNTEGKLDPTVNNFLETAIRDIWGRIQTQPDTYVLTKDEFAVFNFFVRRFDRFSETERAIARYWQNARETIAR